MSPLPSPNSCEHQSQGLNQTFKTWAAPFLPKQSPCCSQSEPFTVYRLPTGRRWRAVSTDRTCLPGSRTRPTFAGESARVLRASSPRFPLGVCDAPARPGQGSDAPAGSVSVTGEDARLRDLLVAGNCRPVLTHCGSGSGTSCQQRALKALLIAQSRCWKGD